MIPKRLATVAILATALVVPARAFAAVDLTGVWVIEYDFLFGPDDETGFAGVQQSGNSLSIGIFDEAMTGTIDPVTGTFDVSSPYNTPTPFGPCNGANLSGTATPDGNSMSGSGAIAGPAGPPRYCAPYNFNFTAHRDPCGNGVLDAGEACDDGNREWRDCCTPYCELQAAGNTCRDSSGPCDPEESCDGVSALCPADQIAPAGTTCRAAADACDVAETCTGSSASCPPDAAPPDADGDGVVDPCDACPATPDAALVEPRLGLSSYDGVAGNDKLLLKTELALTSAAAASLDPIGNGMAIEIGSLAITVPGGAYDPVTREGWRTVPAGNKWTFRGTDPSLAISSAAIKLTGTASAPRAIVKLTGKKRTFADALPEAPLSLHLVLDPPVASSLACGEASFAAEGGPAPACALKAKGTALSCR